MVPWLGMDATSQPVMQDANEFVLRCFKTVYQCIPYVVATSIWLLFLRLPPESDALNQTLCIHYAYTCNYIFGFAIATMNEKLEANKLSAKHTHITNIAWIVSKFKLPYWKSSMILLTTAGSWRNSVLGAWISFWQSHRLGFQLAPSRKASLAHLYLKQRQQTAGQTLTWNDVTGESNDILIDSNDIMFNIL